MREAQRLVDSHMSMGWSRGSNLQSRFMPLTGNETCNPSVHGAALRPLSHTGQGFPWFPARTGDRHTLSSVLWSQGGHAMWREGHREMPFCPGLVWSAGTRPHMTLPSRVLTPDHDCVSAGSLAWEGGRDRSLPAGKAEAAVGLDTISEAAVKARNESRSPQGAPRSRASMAAPEGLGAVQPVPSSPFTRHSPPQRVQSPRDSSREMADLLG